MTSIPGVAQRTGATTYYVEIWPQTWDEIDGAEPVFAPRTSTSEDDDGFVLSFAHDEIRDRSKFVILDAQNFAADPLAEIWLPQRVPYGAHGSWLPRE